MNKYYRTYADIDLDAIRGNITNMQKGLEKGVKTCAVIKADGYGHGAVELAENLKDIVDFFAVACMEEALELRHSHVTLPILILAYTHKSFYEDAIREDVRLTIYDLDSAEKLSKAARKLNKTAKIHIKLNTGMNRIGFKPTEENKQIIQKISRLKGIEIEGIFTHLHSADEKDLTSAKEQIKTFRRFTDDLADMGIHIPIRHCANSAGTILMKEADFDMVRMGISLYGLYPSSYVRKLKLLPGMSLYSHVTMVKRIEKGDTVGYGAAFTAPQAMTIATVSVGYADGYLRNLSNKGYVLINGQKAKIVGNVCMDQIMVDVSRIKDVKVDDVAVLIGRSGNQVITMEEIAALGLTINYEFACGITRRVTRRYIRKGKVVSIRESC
ncbi:MAG: alanine racemase [Lachnospiraceae bacterium]|nr:alanine racemase [Lachnospiraceae bacterium]